MSKRIILIGILLVCSVAYAARFGNISLNGNTISSLDTDGDIVISPNGTGDVDVDTSKIINLTDPTNPQDAATMAYVDLTAGGANEFLSNLSSPVAVNQSFRPDADDTRDLGSTSFSWKFLYLKSSSSDDGGIDLRDSINNSRLRITTDITMPSGTNAPISIENESGSPGDQDIGIHTTNDAIANATPTGTIYYETGNKTDGTGDSGSHIFQTGTSTGGTRGTIDFIDGSEGTAGHVWTSTGTAGQGNWEAAASAGSNNIEYVSIDNGDTPYTVLAADELINCDTASGIVQTNLPAASSNNNRVIRIIKATGDLTGVAIEPDGADTVGGASDTTLNTLRESVLLLADGPNNNWIVISRVIPSAWSSYTPSFTGLGSPNVISFFWRRIGEEIHVRGSMDVGITTAATGTISLPGSLAIETTLLATEKRNIIGSLYGQITTSATTLPNTNRGLWHIAFRASDANSVFMTFQLDQGADSTNSLWDEQNVNGLLATTGAGAMVEFTVPISGWNP